MESVKKSIPVLYRVSVPDQHWEDLEHSDMEVVCNRALARPHPPEGVILDVFHEEMLVNIKERRLEWAGEHSARIIDCPLFELMTLVYLNSASNEFPGQKWISASELKDANFFQGAHALRIGPIIKRYGCDSNGFKKAALKLHAKPMDMADASFQFSPFPKIPICYLLWEGDDEFGPNLTVLFDRSVEFHLNADGILGNVSLITELLANNLSLREL